MLTQPLVKSASGLFRIFLQQTTRTCWTLTQQRIGNMAGVREMIDGKVKVNDLIYMKI